MKTLHFTHKGWFGICPIAMTDPDASDTPCLEPRHWLLEPLFMISEALYDAVFFVKGLTDPTFDPFWPLVDVMPLDRPYTVEVDE